MRPSGRRKVATTPVRVLRAISLLQAEDHRQATAEFERFEEQYPEHDLREDALYWRGIGWSLQREFERAREVMDLYLSTSKSGRYRASATFRKAYCAQQTKDYGTSIRELEAFLREHPSAAECDEARILLGDALMSQGRLDEAVVVFQSISKENVQLHTEGVRGRDPAQAQSGLLEVANGLKVQTDNPVILADCADALLAAGREDEAEDLYRNLLKWNPRAAQKDRALAAIGKAEMRCGKPAAALQLFERFEREIVGSRLLGEVMLSWAQILQASGRAAESREVLEKLLASEYAIGKEKAEALYLIGESHMRDSRPELAIPYFQRLYVMHGRWQDWVAKAYYRSGEAFEKLNDELSARRTYQELTEREDLAGFEETFKARRRLESLRGTSTLEQDPSTEG
jgi:TolA-binding protein